MGWDGQILPVPQIPYTSDLYSDAEDALVALLGADAYTKVGGDGGISRIEARAITQDDYLGLFDNLGADELPCVYIHAYGKEDDLDEHFGTWGAPITLIIAVIQASADRNVLDANTKRRLCEVERVCRQRAGGHEAGGFWSGAYLTVGPSAIDIGDRAETVYRGVGWLNVTIVKEVLNRLEAID